jgi:hypothetical protein
LPLLVGEIRPFDVLVSVLVSTDVVAVVVAVQRPAHKPVEVVQFVSREAPQLRVRELIEPDSLVAA